MPRFGSIFNKINEKLEEAKISDLNHELGKWVQGSNAYLGSFKSGAITVGSKLKTESKGIWRTGGFGSSSSKPSGIPKSLSLPAFPSGPVSLSRKISYVFCTFSLSAAYTHVKGYHNFLVTIFCIWNFRSQYKFK